MSGGSVLVLFIHYSFLRPGHKTSATVVPTIANNDGKTRHSVEFRLLPRMVNCSRALLLQDNSRPYTARQSIAKLEEHWLENLCHPPYSPNIAPTDCHFFRDLDNFLRGKKFNSDAAVKTVFKVFIDYRTQIFFRKGINKLFIKWQKLTTVLI